MSDELARIRDEWSLGDLSPQDWWGKEQRDLAALMRHAEAAERERDAALSTADGALADLEAAQLRIANLWAELEEQWEAAHAEHCRNEWPHGGHCTWPKPAALEETE